jgi:hypothetical protein
VYRFALYASNHGYGHATRMAALAAALIDFGIYVYICTDRPRFLFRDLPDDNWQYRRCRIDGGVVHGQNLKADIPATKQMLLELFSRREEIVAQETEWLRVNSIDLVIADIPYFVIEACGYAEVPVFGVSNFDWAFIYKELFHDDPDVLVLINTIYGLYRRLDRCFVPSLGSAESVPGFREPIFTGLLARKSSTESRVYPQPVLSIMFGGEGDIEIDFTAICAAWDGIVLSTNESCQAANHRRVMPDEDFLAIIKSSDLLLCKPGYSTFAEILSCGKPMLYIPRKHYPEERVLIAGVSGYASARELDTIPESAQEWKAVFDSMPKAGESLATENESIVGRIFSALVQLRRPSARLLSVFDLGSNNLNYCLWDGLARQLTHRVWITTRLARSFSEGKLDFCDLAEDIPALKALLISDKQISSEKHLIATGISRKAENAGELIEQLCSAWHLKGKIISAKDEMKYAWYAAKSHIAPGKKALVFDIGGNSTELVWRPQSRAFAGVSLSLGLITLAQANDPDAMIRQALSELNDSSFDAIIGVGLTVTLLAKLCKGLSVSDLLGRNDLYLSRQDLMDLISNLKPGKVSAGKAQDALELYTMQLAAKFILHLLDRIWASDFLVCNDGISIGFAKWKTK